MFRIRKIYDDTSVANRHAITQVQAIIQQQFPTARREDMEKLPLQLHDPVKYKYRSVLFVADDTAGNVKGFALMLHMADINVTYLELISAAPRKNGGGIGSLLYERIREESAKLKVNGLFFECSIDEDRVADPATLKNNQLRMKFYERYGVYPVCNNAYDTPVKPGDKDLYYLMYDALDTGAPLRLPLAQAVVRAILERKYHGIVPKEQVEEVVESFRDDPAILRAPRYKAKPAAVHKHEKTAIALVVNEGHAIHHVSDKGYLESPIRLPQILKEISRTGLFERVEPRKTPAALLRRIHDPEYLSFLHDVCKQLPVDKSIYPSVFPGRNRYRKSTDVEVQIGCFCTDTTTPLNRNAYLAASGAVDCAVTAAEMLLEDYDLSYALVRPPGHHAEWSKFGGFCYFNSTAAAAEYLSDYGRIAVLDIDFHHGNGTQDIFYERPDILTVSIHGDPSYAYPFFTGNAAETGKGEGKGFNMNLPLPEDCSVELYQKTLAKALKRIATFKPDYLVIALGLDTAKRDPTGSWNLVAKDFHRNGTLIGAMELPILIVQEGGYRTQTLGTNARCFFEGLHQARKKDAAS
ncbi:Acetylpolyamine aminohydrolase [Pontiella desulfatans]|uniref:Acetylpolyamine aminohydrolase n=1 Tax=Pontiella desulfatans TaxID=2750659 RepID=A0A6C2U7S6_PONDE|nr:histone deacetylase family protein [Pontiella desulfatans]VGO15571.1 Acetylpolyamine aminohydrolase [Pontiella desulfatans]